MLHLDLFSGIGGFAYAADQVWNNVEHIFVEYDSFCQQVLKKHWPEASIHGDIRTITDTPSKGLQGQGNQKSPGRPWAKRHIDLVTGGFPCQPFSTAGSRRGTADDRYLWPEMLRVIRLTKPTWVIAENVRGLVNWNDGMVLEQVCADLEAEGYEVQPFIIPAVAVNAPHRRDRVWFIANHPKRNGQFTDQNTRGIESAPPAQPAGSQKALDTTRSSGLQRYDWNTDWQDVAAEFCSVDDGLPVELDGFKLTKAQHRKEQIKAYGNAIVPEVAMEVMRSIVSTYC